MRIKAADSRDALGEPLFHRGETAGELFAQALALRIGPLLPCLFELRREAFARLRQFRREIRLRRRQPLGAPFFTGGVNRNLGIFFRIFRPYRRDLGLRQERR